ncbi:putative cyanate hydratase [Mycobacterium xenopi 3993]|nr:putative cyanate hydratase [Mycobacterium xenopi 3993]
MHPETHESKRDHRTNRGGRLEKGLSWQELADAIGKPVAWTISALLGQQPIPAELGKVLVEMLGLDQSVVPVLAAPPMRGGCPPRCRPTRPSTASTKPCRSTGRRSRS